MKAEQTLTIINSCFPGGSTKNTMITKTGTKIKQRKKSQVTAGRGVQDGKGQDWRKIQKYADKQAGKPAGKQADRQ